MKLLAGSYEKFIWGFSLEPKTLTLSPIFSFPSHSSPIKTVAAAGSVAASGGSDDAVKIYDLSSSSEIATLLDHSAAVTSLSFFCSPVPLNLITASDDGAVCIYDADSFVHLKTVSAVHRRGVADLAVHPSGRLALTVGRDSCLAMVNLVRGRRCFYCKLDLEASMVRYGLGDGGDFFMVKEGRVSMHDSEDARILCEMESKKKVLCLVPSEGGVLNTAGEDRGISGWDTTSAKVAYRIEDAHSSRVKGLSVLKGGNGESSDFIASASSDGSIRIWDPRMISKEKPIPLAEALTKSRLTCLASSSAK